MMPYLSHCQMTFGLGFALVQLAGLLSCTHYCKCVEHCLLCIYPKIPMKSNMQMYGYMQMYGVSVISTIQVFVDLFLEGWRVVAT